MLVGGQMFSLYDRTVMHAFGETVARWRWFWGPAPKTKHGHNFAQRSLRSTQVAAPPRRRRLQRLVDVPDPHQGDQGDRAVAARCSSSGTTRSSGCGPREAGYPTVTLPGVAVWHVPWHEKDDTIDWQAYFHRRNRIIAALLHSPYDRGGRLVRESFETQVKHVLSMQYGPAEMGLMAIEDILEGPQRMHRDVLKRLA